MAGVSRADSGYIGRSVVFGPDGVALAEGGAAEELVVATVDLSAIGEVRSRMPVLQHRRPQLY